MLRFLEERRGVGNFSGTNVNFAQIVVCVEIFRLELHRFAELLFGWSRFAQADEIGGKVGSGRRRSWIEANRLFKVFAGLGVLRLGGIDKPEQFVDFETFRDAFEKLFQFCRRFREMAGVVLGDGGLKVAIEVRGR